MSQEIKQCKKCNVELIPSKALQNAFVGGLEGGSCRRESMNVSNFEIGDTLTRAGTPHMIGCLKCPVCGYSVTANKPTESLDTEEEIEKYNNDFTETTIEVKFKNRSGHHPDDIKEIIENALSFPLKSCDVSIIIKSPTIEDDKCPTCNKFPINCVEYGCGLHG